MRWGSSRIPSKLAHECGLSDEAMRRQLNGTRPLYFDSVLGVMRALGSDVTVLVRPGLRARVRNILVSGNEGIPARHVSRQLP